MSAKISVIIPTYNEADTVINCIEMLQKYSKEVEIIVADSPVSKVNLKDLIKSHDCTYLRCTLGGRNHQMNEGASLASSNILYFVHADTLVHPDYENDIFKSIEIGYDLGSYSFRFDSYPNPLLYINAAFTRLPVLWCRGGDQTLFIQKRVFQALNGFCENHQIMEDYDFLKRANDSGYKFKLIPKRVTVSARKYEKNGYFKVQIANLKVMRRWLKGESTPQELFEFYKKALA